MAKLAGISYRSVGQIWHAFGLKPHRAEAFTLSADPYLVEKVRDIAGLYMNPPNNAVVLCVDEKLQIQALNRLQPLRPMRPGQIERRTHDHTRHGTTTLFAALDYATGKVIGNMYARHRAIEFRKFLQQIDGTIPKELELHAIWDNYATHKTPLIQLWLARPPRFHVHFTPTHSSWLNLVERWFALLTERAIRRGVLKSVHELQSAIREYLAAYNENPQPFKWTKSADEILDNIRRFAQGTLHVHGQ